MQRIQSLDGLRAVSILLVIIGHFSFSIAQRNPVAHVGNLGVKTFFIISGFLITTLLMKEKEKTGRVSLKHFYIRRSLRILPLSYFYILVVAALAMMGVVLETRREFFFATFYLMSYKMDPHNSLAHLWSLSVEEQFYLLWPAVFVLAGPFAKNVAFLAVLSGPAIRAGWWYLFPQYRMAIDTAFPTALDSIAIGCLCAMHWPVVSRVAGKIPGWSAALCPLAAWGVQVLSGELPEGLLRKAYRLFEASGVNLLLAVFVVVAVCNRGWWNKALNWKPMIFIGTISYSLYIWQQLFIKGGPLESYPALARLAAIFAVAIAAHYVIEKPCLKLKDRFAMKAAAAAA